MNAVTLDIRKLAEELSVDGEGKHKAKLALQRAAALVGAPGAEAARKELAAGLAKFLVESIEAWGRRIPQAPGKLSSGRRELCVYLSEIAGPDEVPHLKKVAEEDLEVREAARAALARIPDEAATAALAAVGAAASGTLFKVGAVHSLARRAGAAAVDALRKAADDADPRVRAAAATALSHGAEPGFDGVIQQALDPAKGSAPHADANRLRLRLAANLAKAGHKPEAKKLFDAVAAAPHAKCCDKAIAEGVKALGGR